ncbi:hypothetical protein AWC08_06490 [Mycobacterium gordonae]|uniref:Alpha/beta hydrolase fold-3 domain-containing protein n=1 Tax=Mycobacterium gordonae TaxID=1778 RepID=A0A1X1VJK1_MYCGO|nr:hypothetical protein AWC08_06490 [Mycobacterium gordonae]
MLFDHSADALQLRGNLRGRCPPPRCEPVAQVRTCGVPGAGGHDGIRLRVYQPLLPAAGLGRSARIPLMVYLHGGGFVLCDMASREACCRRFANGVGAVVVAVDYRLAPQHRFPAALDDAWAATRWVGSHADVLGGDPARLVVAGEGAGGNLAAGVCLRARAHQHPPIAFQLLICPILDQRMTTARVGAAGEVITVEQLEWFSDQYLGPDGDRLHAGASPLLADPAGLPPTHIVTAQHDPAGEQGELFAHNLRAAGVPATARRYPGMFHGFFNLPEHLPSAAQANTDVHAIVRDALYDPATIYRTRPR